MRDYPQGLAFVSSAWNNKMKLWEFGGDGINFGETFNLVIEIVLWSVEIDMTTFTCGRASIDWCCSNRSSFNFSSTFLEIAISGLSSSEKDGHLDYWISQAFLHCIEWRQDGSWCFSGAPGLLRPWFSISVVSSGLNWAHFNKIYSADKYPFSWLTLLFMHFFNLSDICTLHIETTALPAAKLRNICLKLTFE